MQDQVIRHVIVRGRQIHYRLRISVRAKHVRLVVSPQGYLVVVVPAGYSLQRLPSLLEMKAAWVLHHLDRVAAQEASSPQHVPDFLTLSGSVYAVVIVHLLASPPSVSRCSHTLQVVAPDDTAAKTVLAQWLRAEAVTVISQCVAHWAGTMGLSYGRVTIRDQRTRWGSCSAAGNLNFNWRLLLAPPEVREYVVIHELAHRTHFNHSAPFWEVVAHYCPDYARHRAWLRTDGLLLSF